MRKLLLVSLGSLLLVAGAAPALSSDGFVMTGADAAYADFNIGDCHLFVGYVEADRVKYFGEGKPAPHSDVQVILSGSCGAVTTPLEGVEQSLDHPRAEMVTLESATLDEFVVPLDESLDAVVDLAWTAVGDIYVETFHAPGNHSAHRTRDAIVTGTVTIGDLVFGSGHLDGAERITHYNEIQKGAGGLELGAVDDEMTTPLDTPVTIDVLANDIYTGSVVVSVQVFPQYGILAIVDVGIFEYTPNAGFVGTDSFTYQICDVDGLCEMATVTIAVCP